MTFSPLLSILGSTPFFATRPFLSTLVLALLARYTSLLPFAPTWVSSDLALAILAVLAAADIFIAKSDDFRRIVNDFGTPIRAVVNLLVTFLLLHSQLSDGSMLADFFGSGGAGVDLFQSLGFLESTELTSSVMALIWSLLCAGSVWMLSELRASLWRALSDVDDGDALGVQGVLSWAEDLWSIFGVVAAVLFPAIAIAIYITTLLTLFVIQKSLIRLQERRKVTCQRCNNAMLVTALACPTCSKPNHAPQDVGLLGQAKAQPALEPAEHSHKLRTLKRCPLCATRLANRAVQQTCTACHTVTFADASELTEYLALVDVKLPKTLLYCGLLSFLPIVGIIPGIIFYHLFLISGLRGYVPRTMGCVTRWGIIALNLILISFQWVPLVGAFMLPLMCLISFRMYRGVLIREGRRLIT